MEQLWGAVAAVFQSWMGRRAIAYRKFEGIPDDWGTAVNVQSMVFGNMGDTSATGVAFTRNPATGENYFYGEWLTNAQGEDVVAGIRTPNPINEVGKNEHTAHLASLETAMHSTYVQLDGVQKKLENIIMICLISSSQFRKASFTCFSAALVKETDLLQ